MSFLKNLREMKSIRSGHAKFERDKALSNKFLSEPHRWTCEAKNPFCSDELFWKTLGLDIDPNRDPTEASAYFYARSIYQKEIAAGWTNIALRNPGKATVPTVFGETDNDDVKIEFVTVEVDEDETPEAFAAKVMRAISEKNEFDSIVNQINPPKQ